MQSDEMIAKIKHLFYAQHYTMNAIGDHLGIHHTTVKNVLDLAGKPHKTRAVSETLLSPYRDVIEQLLEKTPRLRSTRIIQILRDRGYTGGITQLRLLVAELRPKKARAFLSLNIFPGEQAQVDWASFGSMKVGRSERKLSCFVMTLSYSRATFAVFTFDQTLESFLRCHILAFNYLGGIPRTTLTDNLKSAVLDRQGKAVAFNPKYLALAAHYAFFPKAANVRAGWEKGRVERTIRYVRDNFFAGREFKDLHHANTELREWLDKVCNLRPWPQDRSKIVSEVWHEERAKLMPKPSQDFPTDYVGTCVPSKICFVRFDGNDYSAPSQYVGKALTLVASEAKIRILDGAAELASHQRSYSKGERISEAKHFANLHEQKPESKARTKRGEFIGIIPEAAKFFERIIASGRPTGSQTTLLYQYIKLHGKDSVRRAIVAALARDICSAAYVGQILTSMDKKAKELPPPPVLVPDHPQAKNSEVNPHELDIYDEIIRKKPVEGDTHE
jgi:transposase